MLLPSVTRTANRCVMPIGALIRLEIAGLCHIRRVCHDAGVNSDNGPLSTPFGRLRFDFSRWHEACFGAAEEVHDA
jgi:hypothetical protein